MIIIIILIPICVLCRFIGSLGLSQLDSSIKQIISEMPAEKYSMDSLIRQTLSYAGLTFTQAYIAVVFYLLSTFAIGPCSQAHTHNMLTAFSMVILSLHAFLDGLTSCFFTVNPMNALQYQTLQR